MLITNFENQATNSIGESNHEYEERSPLEDNILTQSKFTPDFCPENSTFNKLTRE
ncbi:MULTISPECIES: hypothetical protein [unclassified Anabaena]|uniref:hypothetical protein n=1 Tax=unclassified Anabaena TaxID=2619674 RepID=UPI000B2596AD|nr:MULTISPECIES: hypothetical protein [unclassified Anabaena]